MVMWLRRVWTAVQAMFGGCDKAAPFGRIPIFDPATGRTYYVHAISGGVDTNVPAGAAEAVKRWAQDIYLELPERVFWGPYMQKDINAIIEVKEDLHGKPGDQIAFTLAAQLSGGGTQGDAKLEDSEEVIPYYTQTITIDQFRNAVRLNGRMSEQRTMWAQQPVAKQLLKDWLASFIDNRIFTTISGSPTTAIYGGTATSTATISTGDYLTLALITKGKTKARKAARQIFPVQIEGSDYFLLVVSPDSMLDLKTFDPGWAQAQREAQQRGASNPIFTGAEGIWDNTIIRSSTRVPITTNWGSGANLNGSENMFLGRQAAVFAWGKKPDWVIQSFDYANKTGHAIGAMFEVAKATFNSLDNGEIGIRVFRSNT